MKKIIALVLVLCSLLTLTACDAETMKVITDSIGAITKIASGGNKYEYANCTLVIRDSAGVITPEEEEALVSKLTTYCSQIDCDVLIMSTDEIGLSSLSPGESYGKAYLPKDTENWISISFDKTRMVYHIGYEGDLVYKALTESELDKALNLGYGPLNKEQYAKAFEVMAEFCLKEIAKQK